LNFTATKPSSNEAVESTQKRKVPFPVSARTVGFDGAVSSGMTTHLGEPFPTIDLHSRRASGVELNSLPKPEARADRLVFIRSIFSGVSGLPIQTGPVIEPDTTALCGPKAIENASPCVTGALVA
jgi:hypothetical protein